MVSESSFSWMIDVTNRLNGSHSATSRARRCWWRVSWSWYSSFPLSLLSERVSRIILHRFDGWGVVDCNEPLNIQRPADPSLKEYCKYTNFSASVRLECSSMEMVNCSQKLVQFKMLALKASASSFEIFKLLVSVTTEEVDKVLHELSIFLTLWQQSKLSFFRF